MENVTKHSIPVDILDDLGSRFIINVPEEERKDVIRLFFQIELAHWFYLDFYCTQENKRLRPCGMKEFAAHIFQHIPFLSPLASNLEEILEQWREYKQSVPTFGAILLSEDLTNVLLVQGFWARASWGFPKGKMNEDEDPCRCAVREVLEETGCDVSRLIRPDLFIQATINYQVARLYIVPGVSMETEFKPQTRGEIRSVQWFVVADLPTAKKDVSARSRLGVGPNAFFMVLPFIKRLKTWIRDQQKPAPKPRSQSLSESHVSDSRPTQPLSRTVPRKTNEPLAAVPRKTNEPLAAVPRKTNEPMAAVPRKTNEPLAVLTAVPQRKPVEQSPAPRKKLEVPTKVGALPKSGAASGTAKKPAPSAAKDGTGQARRQLFSQQTPAAEWLSFSFNRAPLEALFV